MYRLFQRDPALGVPEMGEFIQMVHPDDRQPLVNAQERAARSGRLVHIEYRAFPAGNEMRYFRASMQVVKDEQGKAQHISGTVLDITENRLMEIEIQERVKELTCLFNVSRLLGSRQETLETVCNKIVASIIPAMQFPHLTIPLLTLDDQRYTTDGFDENLTHRLCANIEVDGRVRGQICVFYTRNEPFVLPEEQDMLDNIARMVGLWVEQRESEAAVRAAQMELEELNRDLEKRVEERTNELRQSESVYRALFENSNDGIFLMSPEGKDITANQQAVKMLGYTLQEYLALPSNSITAPEQQIDADERFAAAVRGYYVPLYERTFIGKDGKKVEVEINLSPVRDATGKIIMVQSVVRDITERKKAQEVLRESRDKLSAANAALERASHMKDEFLASMSHELRTPLTGILGLSEVLQLQTFGALNEKQNRALKNIESSGRHLLDLINDILDLSKIEAGKLDLQFEPCPVSEICQSSLQLMKGMAHQKKQVIDFSMKPALINVRADARRLKQMLVNLLSNAVKFTPEGGKLGLDVVANENEKTVSFTVWDKGIGIDPGALEKLFKPFTQLDSSLARQYSGTGLGLSLVQRMAELHGGSVRVESSPGEGSRFTISLPWVPGETQPVYTREKRDTGSLKSAMVIEDNELDAEHMIRYLKGLGIAHITQTIIHGAIEKAALLQPNVILLDLNMPDGSGLELLAKLKLDERTRDVPVIVVSVEERRTEALKLGAVGYLLKPYTQQELRAELGKAATFLSPTLPQITAKTGMDESAQLVVIADDNELILQMVSDFLEANGFRVVTTRSGVELLERVAESRPDIMLVDIQMPVMDGMETIRRLRAHTDPAIASTPIIAITALAMSGDREKCLEAGANEYLSKPIVLVQLVKRIRELLKDGEDSRSA
jgi:PAS domain S-box-containing protein